MSQVIIEISLTIAQTIIALALVLATWRLIRGPRAQDRVIALDSLYLSGMLMLVLIGMRAGTTLYFEAALVIGMLSFVGTVALAKFLMRGEVIE
jgi:multicomponent K+:H+ antiporter subunit F